MNEWIQCIVKEIIRSSVYNHKLLFVICSPLLVIDTLLIFNLLNILLDSCNIYNQIKGILKENKTKPSIFCLKTLVLFHWTCKI